MKQDTKRTLMLCILLAFYIVLAILGVYSIEGNILLTVLAIPLTLYMIKNTNTLGTHVLYNIAVLLAIYALTGTLESILIYAIGIGVPAYAISYFYKKKYPLPNIIMYAGVISASAFLLYQSIMRAMGINYEMQYITEAENIKTLLTPILVGQAMAMSSTADKNLEVQLTQMFVGNFDLIKQLFAAMHIIKTFIFTIIQVIITHSILRRRDKTLPTLGQLLEFRISKVLLVILAGAILLMAVATDTLSGTMILGVNIVVMIYMLFMLVGLLSIIGLIKKSSISKGVKIISGIFLGIVVVFSPTLLILFGFLDTIFNFRKVTIVV